MRATYHIRISKTHRSHFVHFTHFIDEINSMENECGGYWYIKILIMKFMAFISVLKQNTSNTMKVLQFAVHAMWFNNASLIPLHESLSLQHSIVYSYIIVQLWQYVAFGKFHCGIWYIVTTAIRLHHLLSLCEHTIYLLNKFCPRTRVFWTITVAKDWNEKDF